MIIDIHCHYTTEPQALLTFRDKQLAGLADPMRKPATTELGISDEQLVQSVQPQLKNQRERGGDLTHLLAARAGHGAPHRHRGGEPRVGAHEQRPHPSHLHAPARQLRAAWASCRSSRRADRELHPGARAPRGPRVRRREPEPDPRAALERPAALPTATGIRSTRSSRARDAGDDPRVDVVQPDVPLHRWRTTSTADTTAFVQLLQKNVFADFPTLKFVIPHGGGAAPYHWGRYRGFGVDQKKPDLVAKLMENVFFDTCVYHLRASSCSRGWCPSTTSSSPPR
jgi:4-oxalmesaconate hydratase